MKLTDAKSFIRKNYLGELTQLDKYEITNTLRFGLTKNQQFKIMIWLEELSFKYYEKIKKYKDLFNKQNPASKKLNILLRKSLNERLERGIDSFAKNPKGLISISTKELADE